jgi:Protein of unknown function (DUF2971)
MKLYKYFPKERVDFIPHRLVRLTPPVIFNDPFDMSPVSQITFLGDERLNAIKPPRKSIFNPDGRPYRNPAANFMEDLAQSIRMLQLNASAKYGVFCLSERYDSLLMWAHYASNHEGFVVEFDAAHKWLSQRKVKAKYDDLAAGGLHKITYSDERPTATILMQSLTKISPLSNLIDSYFIKGNDWSYEREWRLVKPLDQATKIISLSPNDKQPNDQQFPSFVSLSPDDIALYRVPYAAITSIIFGARMSEADREALLQCRKIRKFDHVQFSRATLSKDRFELEFKQVPTEPVAIGRRQARKDSHQSQSEIDEAD